VSAHALRVAGARPTAALGGIVAAWLATAALLTAGLAGASSAPVVAGTAVDDPRLVLVEQTTWVPPNGDFTVRVAAHDAPPGSSITMTVHDLPIGRIQFRDGLDDENLGPVLNEGCAVLVNAGIAAPEPCSVGLDEAEFDQDGAVTLGIGVRSGEGPSDRLLIPGDADGAYPVRLGLVGPDGEELAVAVTHLLRTPVSEEDSPPLSLAVVLPITSPVGRQPDGTVALPADDLARLEAIAAILAAHPDVPVVLVPRPETLVALEEVAPDTLAAFREAAAGRQVLARPYVDIDPAAWWAAGLDGDVTQLLTDGTDTTAALLDTRPDRRTWPLEPTQDEGTIDRLRTMGVDQLIVGEERLDPLDETRFPFALDRPFDVVSADGTRVPAVMDDAGLRAHVGATGDPVLDAHHLLADLTVLYSQQPGIPRGVAFSLPADELDLRFLDELLDGLAAARQIEARTVDDLLATAEPAHADGHDAREGPNLERTMRSEEPADVAPYAGAVAETRAELVPYAAMAGPDASGDIVEELIRVSGDRRLDGSQQTEYLDGALAQVSGLASGVRAPEQGRVTLTAREGRIPIVLANDLDRPVDVLVRLESDKLEFPEGDEQRVTLQPGENRLEWLVTTRATGAFPVDVSLLSPDGSLELDSTRFTMRSTAVPGVGIALSALAAVFLAVWWARHWHSTRRAARLMPAESADATAQDRLIDQLTDV
jgi:hypothetical protein